MLNRVCLAGRQVDDVELRATKSGIVYTVFEVAVDRDFKERDGTCKTDTVTVAAYDKTADYIAKYGAKNRLLMIDGRLRVHSTRVEVVADHINFG